MAATPTGQSPDHGQLTPMLQTARENLKRVGITEPVSEVLADSGYWNTSQVRELTVAGHDVLIPPIVRGKRHGPEVQTMLDRLDTDGGKQRYRRRQHIIEPVFARCKHHRGITRVLRRGKTAVQSEISLIATTHNLLKLHTALQAG